MIINRECDRRIIFEYQQVLLGKTAMIATAYFVGNVDPMVADRNALTVLRYAIENILHWTPEQMRYKFNQDIADRLHVSHLLTYVQCPPEIDKKIHWFWFAHRLYPNVVKIDNNRLALLVYNNAMVSDKRKLPKGFFEDIGGKERAEICLNSVLLENLKMYDIGELYAFFSTPEGTQFIIDHNLDAARQIIWDDSQCGTLDMFHDSLAPSQRSNVLYYFQRFKIAEKEGQQGTAQ